MTKALSALLEVMLKATPSARQAHGQRAARVNQWQRGNSDDKKRTVRAEERSAWMLLV